MFQLTQEYVNPYCTIRNYVRGREFFNLCDRKMGGVVLETTHPSMLRKVCGSVDEAIAAVKTLGWEVA